MEYRPLVGTDLRVSRLCLGVMTFGQQVDQADAERMLALAIDAGINFVDTANVYQTGRSETMLGLAMRHRREGLIVASKIGNSMGAGSDENGLSRPAILRAVESCLRRLGTDRLDICYLHKPDHDVAIEETLEAMETLVRQGKVRCLGTSNYASWQVAEMHAIAARNGGQAPHLAQQMLNLLARGLEAEFVPMAKRFGVAITVYNPLAGGLLTGKHHPGVIEAGGRFDTMPWYQDRYWNPANFAAVERLRAIAAEAGRSLVGLSLTWLLHHTAADSIILGASNPGHLAANIAAAAEGPLPGAVVAACDAVWRDLRGPSPAYHR